MLGGQRNQALYMNYQYSRPYMGPLFNVDEKPDWDNAPYVYKGTSNRSSFNHTAPSAYVDKSERASTTGAYKKDKSLSAWGDTVNLLQRAMAKKPKVV
jgi:hypothetical protein